ncbi:MAG: hypothetical protein A2017_02060 [Lentisphaerae bacterium GWF2_44_16]|nr:MAG: hypothetical protein A2017_02060 [Lentisphaerae bacterium GWF2_44_16]
MDILNIRHPLEEISGFWKFVRTPRKNIKARSTPGHLLHLIISGRYTLKTNNRIYHVKPGDIIYYYASEDVEWMENTETVVFYSVAFVSSMFKPLPYEKRVMKANIEMKKAFNLIYEYSLSPDEFTRTAQMFSSLSGILLEIEKQRKENALSDCHEQSSGTWEIIEDKIRREKLFRVQLSDLCAMAGKSRASVIRACRKSTGTTPLKRIHELRMNEAEGLLRFSTLNVTQIAEYLHYPRMHEFSREFKRHFAFAPTRIFKD